jgi:RNA polymerase sigma-70 factor (ECF subfamily)
VRADVHDPDIPDAELMDALTILTPAQRAVVALRFYLDWTVEDVAQALGKRPGTIRALTHQGIERLRSQLKEEQPDG